MPSLFFNCIIIFRHVRSEPVHQLLLCILDLYTAEVCGRLYHVISSMVKWPKIRRLGHGSLFSYTWLPTHGDAASLSQVSCFSSL